MIFGQNQTIQIQIEKVHCPLDKKEKSDSSHRPIPIVWWHQLVKIWNQIFDYCIKHVEQKKEREHNYRFFEMDHRTMSYNPLNIRDINIFFDKHCS